jgi:nucleoside-diphosphate-sugar epimerase
MQSDHSEPLNLGTDVMVTVDQLVDMVCAIAGKNLEKRHDTSKPQGVRGRNSDNSRLTEVLDWAPQIGLHEGLQRTYAWIEQELFRAGRVAEPAMA